MRSRSMLVGGVAVALLSAASCQQSDQGADASSGQANQAGRAAASSTIADGLAGEASDSRFLAAAKASGLDRTLAGAGPYTVLVPDDTAFGKLPAGALDALMNPGARAQLTGVLTYHILPGTVLAADIGKAIDSGKGKTVLATMGGGTLTATRDGQAILLADSTGTRARIVRADDARSNGVIHRIDAVLMPS